LDYTAWLRRRTPMGIVRLSGRDAVRLSTVAREREGQLASSDARGVGPGYAVGAGSVVDLAASEGARHTAADRTRVRRVLPSEGDDRLAS
jgi:hypothetical protein